MSQASVILAGMNIVFHKTIRLADGKEPANLPPSLGRFPIYPVSEYRSKVPTNWESGGYFIGIQETEALWMSFSPRSEHPLALLVGAGGVNAVTGENHKLQLEEGNYLVAPPQSWLDGFKNKDGSVYQFVGTAYKAGSGDTVGEQLRGEESKTGGIGIAAFEAKDYSMFNRPTRSFKAGGSSAGGQSLDAGYPEEDSLIGSTFSLCADEEYTSSILMECCSSAPIAKRMASPEPTRGINRSIDLKKAEMGLGKGAAIKQKIYPDPYSLDFWKTTPTATTVIYLVNEAMFQYITGTPLKPVATQQNTGGPYFEIADNHLADVEGSSKFDKLKPATKSPVGVSSGAFD